jgi:fatty acid desaturase
VAAEASTDGSSSLVLDFVDLRGLTTRELLVAMLHLAGCWAVVFAVLALVDAHPSWWTALLALVLVASRQHAMLSISHDCTHATFVSGRSWNERVGIFLCSSPVASPYFSTQAHHMEHHRALGSPGDPDAELHQGPDKQSRGGLLVHFLSALCGGYAVRTLFRRPAVVVGTAQRNRDLRNILVSQIVLFALMTALFDWWVYPFFWALPLGTLTVFLHLTRSFCEHALLPGEESRYAGRLVSFESNPVERFFLSPYYFNYHAEHHLFPFVPGPHLAKASRRLREHPAAPEVVYRQSYLGLIRRYLASFEG